MLVETARKIRHSRCARPYVRLWTNVEFQFNRGGSNARLSVRNPEKEKASS